MLFIGWSFAQSKDSNKSDGLSSPKKKVLINPPGTESAYHSWEYSQAVRVGDTIWVSGKTGNNYGVPVEGIEAQTRLAFKKIDQILREAGSSLDDIVEIVTYHTSMKELDKFKKVKSEFLTKNFPAWTAIGVKELVFPGLLIEIKVTAVVGSGAAKNKKLIRL
jgi:enamine deaminase RidA (YjgF/YER057c/UK114 family)